ncbi:MAG: hypothetical protein JWL82_619 [Parcubacteria group bacterium]|nr:hypothetical protein [Parcubacteria group bacterium]
MRAFTIVEVIVLVSVTVVVGMALNSMIVNFYRSNAYLLQQSSAIDSAHRGLRTSFEDLREASYGDDGSYPIQTAASSTITFYSDIDGDGSVEKIHLYLAGVTFYRGVTDSSSSPPTYVGQTEKVTTIANYVRNSSSTPLFSYYDSDGTLLASSTVDVSQISSVSTTVLVDLNPLRAPDILTLQEKATLRNLRAQ